MSCLTHTREIITKRIGRLCIEGLSSVGEHVPWKREAESSILPSPISCGVAKLAQRRASAICSRVAKLVRRNALNVVSPGSNPGPGKLCPSSSSRRPSVVVRVTRARIPLGTPSGACLAQSQSQAGHHIVRVSVNGKPAGSNPATGRSSRSTRAIRFRRLAAKTLRCQRRYHRFESGRNRQSLFLPVRFRVLAPISVSDEWLKSRLCKS